MKPTASRHKYLQKDFQTDLIPNYAHTSTAFLPEAEIDWDEHGRFSHKTKNLTEAKQSYCL